MARQRIGELLVAARVITQEQLDTALRTERVAGQRLGDLLVQLRLVSEAQLTQTLGQQLSVPWVSLYHVDFSRQLLNLVPHAVAEKYCLIPIYVRRVKRQGDTLYVAMDDPTNEAAMQEVQQHAGLPVKPMIASPSDIRNAIRVYYGVGAEPAAAAEAVVAPATSTSPKKPPPPPKASREPIPPTVRERPLAAPPPETPALPEPPVAAAPEPSAATSGDSPEAEPEIEAQEVVIPHPRKSAVPMVALTMLDGTTIQLPARRAKRKRDEAPSEEPKPAPKEEAAPDSSPLQGADALTARDLIRALRAMAEGADVKETLGEEVRWERVAAALYAVLLRKGLVADWELIEEYRRRASE